MIRIAAGKEGEGVHVADGQPQLLQPLAQPPNPLRIHVPGQRMRHIGHQLHAAIADARDRLDRLFERVFLEGVGGEGQVDHLEFSSLRQIIVYAISIDGRAAGGGSDGDWFGERDIDPGSRLDRTR